MKFEVGPTGSTVIGHVLDCTPSGVERMLKAYDPLLYIKWNPNKAAKFGCWEIRRKPDSQVIISTEKFDGQTYHILGYKEIDINNHVLDVPYMNYEVLNRLKRMDTWALAGYDKTNRSKMSHFWDRMDGLAKDQRTAQEQKNYDDLLYSLKQQKSALRTYKEAILSGVNPADIAKYWK